MLIRTRWLSGMALTAALACGGSAGVTADASRSSALTADESDLGLPVDGDSEEPTTAGSDVKTCPKRERGLESDSDDDGDVESDSDDDGDVESDSDDDGDVESDSDDDADSESSDDGESDSDGERGDCVVAPPTPVPSDITEVR